MSIERRSGWLGLALFASIAVNLFLGGIVIGRASFAPRGQTSVAAAARMQLGERLREMPGAERRQFLVTFWRDRGDLLQAGRALGETQAKVAALIAAPVLDQAALTAAFAEVRSATTHAQASLHAALVPALATLGPETRRKLLEKNPDPTK